MNDDREVIKYTDDIQFENVAATEAFLANYDQYEKYGVGHMIVTLKETCEISGW